MNKVLRVLLLTVVVLTMVVPMTVSAGWDWRDNLMMTIPGRIWNGDNAGPAFDPVDNPITVSLYRDTGGGPMLISQKDFIGTRRWEIDPVTHQPVPAPEEWFNTMSANGDFLFQVSCVPGYYTLEISDFLGRDGAAVLGVAFWANDPPIGKAGGHKLKDAQGAGPWSYSWQAMCDNVHAGFPYKQVVFEYLAAGGRDTAFNAGWMYLSGKTISPNWAPRNPNDYSQAVAGVTIRVSRIWFDERDNWANPDVEINLPGAGAATFRTTVSGNRGLWGMGLSKEPGFYKVEVADDRWDTCSANPIFFQVWDFYRGGDPYGPGSSWLPWDFVQRDWIYGNLNFCVRPAS